MPYLTSQPLIVLHQLLILLIHPQHFADPVSCSFCLDKLYITSDKIQIHTDTNTNSNIPFQLNPPIEQESGKDQLDTHMICNFNIIYRSVQKLYLLCSSKCMVEAGDIGHDGSLIWLWGVYNIYSYNKDRQGEGDK